MEAAANPNYYRPPVSATMSGRTFQHLSAFVQDTLGIKMPGSKKTMLQARLLKRLRSLGMYSFEEYCDYVFSPADRDGITFLQKIMTQHPIPVVICSTLTEQGSETAMRALEYGAVEIIVKPKLGTKQFLEESRVRICDAVKAAALVPVKRMAQKTLRVQPKLTADAVIARADSRAMAQTTEKVVVGASTGGTEALRIFLEQLPADAPGMVIVQHMPEHFTAAFARRLDSLCQVAVKEAENNDSVLRGRVLIAPGNRHTLLKLSGARYYVEVKDGPLVSRHRPSVDVLFRSAARYAGKNAVGVIMTGMGDDGASGMLEMKQAGAALTIAQDEQSSVVFGMPLEAISGAVIMAG